MKILFHLGHPAHFHLFKNSISELKALGHQTIIVIKKKDVLEDLLQQADWDYVNCLPEGKKRGKLNLISTQWKQIRVIRRLAKKEHIDLLCGTSAAISVVGKMLGIPSYNFNEDDAEAVPLYAKMAYPWATKIFAPRVCSVGKWESKKIAYESYHELAYLHPDHFSPSLDIAQKYLDPFEPFFILRFAQLTAHHDRGVGGISRELAQKITSLLLPHGKVYISSEKALDKELEAFVLKINPLDMHHVLAFSKIFIGDSQTMAAEAAVLGVPMIRCTDFVGKISYLNELENNYGLGYGFRPDQGAELLQKLTEMLGNPNLKSEFQKKRTKMLAEKTDLSKFITENILLAFEKKPQ